MSVHGHDDTVGDDGEDDQVLEGRPTNEPDEHSPKKISLFRIGNSNIEYLIAD